MRNLSKATLLIGAFLVFVVFTLKGSVLLVPSGTWAPTANLTEPPAGASAVLLADGHILITGGEGTSGALATAELFGADGSVSPAAAMNVARSKHISVVLQDGRVLVAGGTVAGGGISNAAEIYDPAANSWSSLAGGMTEARSGATAALLQDGRVLIAGGDNAGVPSSTIEIFDPAAGTFSFAGTLSSPRENHAMALLADGRVLIVGGFNGSVPLASTDIFDPAAGSVAPGPSLAAPRFGHSATTLLDGRVLVAGGNNGQTDLASAEIYDPSAGTFSPVASTLAAPRQGHLAFLLPHNNNVLIVGGTSAGVPVAASELFTPWQGTFAGTGALTTARSGAAGSAMQQDGLLLVAGGSDANGAALASSELYGFATVKTDQADYAPGSIVTITGSGWQPGETVTLTLVESPLIDTHTPLTAVADASGNISNNQFSPDSHDINILFYLTAVGSQSGLQAQTTFTDALSVGKIPTVGAQTPSPVSAGNPATYSVTVSFSGNGTCDALLSATGLPTGASASFAPLPSGNPANTITSTGSNVTTTLTVSTTAGMTPGTTTFTITATGINGCNNSASTNPNGTGQNAPNPTLVVSKAASTTTFGAAPTPTYLGGNFTVSASNDSGGAITYSQVSGPCALVSGSTFSSSGAGICVVQADSAATTGYLASSAQQTVTIAKATPTITWSNPADITYGTALNATQLNATASVAGTFTYTPASGTVLAFGSNQNLHVDFTPTDTADYNNASTDVKINVDKKSLTPSITADNKDYDGSIAATIHCTLTGVLAGDTANVSCSGTGSFADANAGSGKTVRSSDLTLSGSASGNYQLSTTTATTTATINKKSVTPAITADNKDYDGSIAATIHCTLTGVLAGDTANVSCSGTGSFADANAGSGKTVTSSDLTLSGSASGNYQLSTTTATTTATINKAKATITVTPYHVTYDGNAHTATGSAKGVLNESLSGLNLSGTTHTNAATYGTDPWTFTDVTGNYNDTSDTVSDSIAKATLSVTANDTSRTYGDPNPTFTASYSGFKNSETLATSGVTGSPSLTTTATAASLVPGPYTITAALGTLAADNYNFMFFNGALTITKATLTVTADNKTMLLHDVLPTFTASYNGFKNGEMLTTSGVTGSPSLTTLATSASPVGSYTITAALGSLAGTNYTFVFANGTLTVTYNICVLYDQIQPKKFGSTIPVKLQLCDVNGANYSSAAITVTATGLIIVGSTDTPLPPEDSGNANPDDNFRLADGMYIFNLSTKPLFVGKWRLSFIVSGEPGPAYAVQFQLK
jgi:hypothetical protein